MLVVIRKRAAAWADDHLIPQWRHAYKFFSIQSAALQMAVLMTWATLPDDLKSALPGWLLPCIAGFVLSVGVVGRMTHQDAIPPVKTGE